MTGLIKLSFKLVCVCTCMYMYIYIYVDGVVDLLCYFVEDSCIYAEQQLGQVTLAGPAIPNITVRYIISTEILHIRKHVRYRSIRHHQLCHVRSLTTVSINPRIIIVSPSSVWPP
jgi:hypothetical protein